jgi:hypothetical protein
MENYVNMSMDQLMERQKLIYKKYMAAVQGGASAVVLDQMVAHMDQIRHALWEIGYKQSFDAQNKNDSDPFKDSIV